MGTVDMGKFPSGRGRVSWAEVKCLRRAVGHGRPGMLLREERVRWEAIQMGRRSSLEHLYPKSNEDRIWKTLGLSEMPNARKISGRERSKKNDNILRIKKSWNGDLILTTVLPPCLQSPCIFMKDSLFNFFSTSNQQMYGVGVGKRLEELGSITKKQMVLLQTGCRHSFPLSVSWDVVIQIPQYKNWTIPSTCYG